MLVPRYACLVGMLLTCICCIPLAAPVYAQTQNSNIVRVGLYVLNIGRLDVASGTFVIDFYLSMRCAGSKCNMGSFEFMNGRATSIQLIENKTTEKFWRIEANLYVSPDLRHYPFDSHSLAIQIEDTSLTSGSITYEPDPSNSGLDPSIAIVGWTLAGWTQTVVNQYYKVYNETYTQYVFPSMWLENEYLRLKFLFQSSF